MFQDLPARIERNVEPNYKRKKLRFHPEMLHELMYMTENSEDDYFGFLIIISLYKDDMPWVYEIGKETYEILKSSKAFAAKEKAISNFRKIIKNTMHHPIFMNMMGSKDQMMMLDELTYFMEKFLNRMLDKKE